VTSLEDVRQEQVLEVNPWVLTGWAESLLVRVPSLVTDEHTSEDLHALAERVRKVQDIVEYVEQVIRDMAQAKVHEEITAKLAESWRIPPALIFGEADRKRLSSQAAAEARLRGR